MIDRIRKIQNMENYQKEVMKTASNEMFISSGSTDNGKVHPQLLHGAIGAVTESGEILELIKKAVFYGRKLNKDDLVLELGDVEWYCALIRETLGITQEEVQRRNIDKLRSRYSEGFDSHESELKRDTIR